jgi:hypothetical protein
MFMMLTEFSAIDVLVERGMVIGMTGSPSEKEPPTVITPFVPTAENIAELITRNVIFFITPVLSLSSLLTLPID